MLGVTYQVGGCTLSGLLGKSWSNMSSLLHPTPTHFTLCFRTDVVQHSIPTARRFTLHYQTAKLSTCCLHPLYDSLYDPPYDPLYDP